MKIIYKYYDCEKLDAKVIEAEHEVALCNSGKAIVFFEAEWSGSSRMHAAALAHKLNTLDLSNTSFFVINIDHISEKTVTSVLGKQSHGNGEAVFLNSGKMIARHASGESFKNFLKYLDDHLKKLP